MCDHCDDYTDDDDAKSTACDNASASAAKQCRRYRQGLDGEQQLTNILRLH